MIQLNRRHFVLGASGAVVASALPAHAQTGLTLDVLYSGAYVIKDTMEEITRQFEARQPEIGVKLTAVRNYTEMTQLILRAAVTGNMPDVGFQGLSFVRLFVERDLAVPLDGLIKAETDWAAQGYAPSVMSLAEQGGRTYGVPFAISVPTIYYNANLVRAAGGDADNFPTSWPEIIALGKSISAPSGGIYFDYTPTANWTFIAFVQSQGGRMMTPDDRQIAFDGTEGRAALRHLREIGAAGMRDMSRDQAKQAFVAGSMGILITSSSDITLFTEQAGGRFDLRVAPFPVVTPNGTLPAGGNAAMIHTKDPRKQKAAWDYIKYATGAVGQTVMVKKTAYMPVNTLPLTDPNLLGAFYETRPNLMVPVRQLPVVTGWFSFPGENSLKIISVIEERLRAVVTLKQLPDEALGQMTGEVRGLLPRS